MEIVHLKSKVKLSEITDKEAALPLHKDAEYIKELKAKFIAHHNKSIKKKEVKNAIQKKSTGTD